MGIFYMLLIGVGGGWSMEGIYSSLMVGDFDAAVTAAAALATAAAERGVKGDNSSED